MLNRKNRLAFPDWLCRQPNGFEGFFNKLRHFRAVATRYDKLTARHHCGTALNRLGNEDRVGA